MWSLDKNKFICLRKKKMGNGGTFGGVCVKKTNKSKMKFLFTQSKTKHPKMETILYFY